MGMTNETPNVRCPRCGYDQRGVVRTWTEQCPMEGTCSECGLVFAWCEVLRSEKFEPRWCIEYEPRISRLPWATANTFFRSFLPWRFWSRLRMSHAVRIRRLVLYPILIVLPLLAIYCIVQGAVAIRVRWLIEQDLTQRFAAATARLPQLERMVKTGVLEGQWLTHSKDDAVYGRSTLDQVRQIWEWDKAVAAFPPAIQFSYFEAVVEGFTNPFGTTSAGTITFAGQTSSYPPPSQMYAAVFSKGLGFWGAGRLQFIATHSATWLGITSTLAIALPTSFVLLPVTRRRAKVRWSHIGRIAVYSVFIPIALCLAFALCVSFSLLTEATDEGWAATLPIIGTCGPGLLLGIWWWCAIRNYLRIPKALFTTLMLTALCSLSIIAVTWLVHPDLIIDY